MFKRFISVLLALTISLSLSAPAFATEDTFYLNEIKQAYVNGCCFYQITDADYLDQFANDEVIEVFHNIKVTKNLLNDNLILDIDRVTENDVVPECSTQSSGPLAQETQHILPTTDDNVVVIKKGVIPAGQFAGTGYITTLYLSNQGISDFIRKDWVNEVSLGDTLNKTVVEWIISNTVSLIPSQTFGAVFSLVVGVANLGSIKVEQEFRVALNNIYENGGRAVVTMTIQKRTCEVWSDRYFYTEDCSRNGMDISSAYRTYRNN